MTISFNNPINCPNCHKPLLSVQVTITDTLDWIPDKEDRGKFEDNGQVSADVICNNCNKKIGHYDKNEEWGLFPESTAIKF